MPFEPIPGILLGVDTDTVLTGDAARRIRNLPRFSDLNLLRIEPEEAGVVVGALLKANKRTLSAARAPLTPWQTASKLAAQVDSDALVAGRGGLGPLTGEYVLEAWLADHLSHDDRVVPMFGAHWAYVARQEPASPMKPRAYTEFIDIFGYQTLDLAPNLLPAITKYKVVEVKGVRQSNGAVLHQTLKYVDWIAHNRAGG
ncbi:MAG: hypothetical protein ACREMY_31690, partial [bacterium]